MGKKVLVIGSLNYDFMMGVDRLPAKGETLTALSLETSSGGKGANQGVQTAVLGIPTYICGAVGEDNEGKYLRNQLNKFGVNTTYLKTASGKTGMGFVQTVKDGNVYATIYKGANHRLDKNDIDSLEPLLKEKPIVLIQMEIPIEIIEYAIELANSYGCEILVNTAPAFSIKMEILKKVSLIIMNEIEAEFYLQKKITTKEDVKEHMVTFSKELNVPCVITLGSRGAAYVNGNELSFYPPPKAEVVETTGAGDSFIGGLAYAIINKMQTDEMMSFASACSGVTISGVGAQCSMPALGEVIPLFKAYIKELGR